MTRTLAQALCDAGINAVDAWDFLDGIQFVGGTVEDVAQGRTVVAWDVDYIDSERFPLKDHRGVLVTRVSEIVPMETLVKRMVQLVCALKDQGTPKDILVMEPMTAGLPSRLFAGNPKEAA